MMFDMETVKSVVGSGLVAMITGMASSIMTIAILKNDIDWIKRDVYRHEEKIQQLDYLRNPIIQQKILNRRVRGESTKTASYR